MSRLICHISSAQAALDGKDAPSMTYPENRFAGRRRLTNDEFAEWTAHVVHRYQHGTSIRAIAEATGRSYGTVHYALTRAEVPRRAAGGTYTSRIPSQVTAPVQAPSHASTSGQSDDVDAPATHLRTRARHGADAREGAAPPVSPQAEPSPRIPR
jgi:hypothetical protein